MTPDPRFPPNRVRQYRQDLLLTQAELAALVGVTKQAISSIERGAQGAPFWRTQKRIARAPEVPEATLFPASHEEQS